jgi:DNA modification methylase
MLRLELEDLRAADFDLDLLGFNADELGALLSDEDDDTEEDEGLTDADAVPDAPAQPVTNAGDVWQLGNHRITCGSCRDSKDVGRLLAGAKINLAFTSPPYAAQRTYDESSGFKPIDPDHYVQWYADVAANIHSNLADDGSYFCNIKEHAEDGVRHTYVKRLLLTHLDAWGWRWVDEFCWIRQGIPGDAEGMGRFRNAWESIFWFSKNKRPKFNPKAVRHVSEGAFSYADQLAAGKTIGAKNQGAGSASNSPVGHGHGLAYPSNVLDLKQKAETLGHAAAFPVVLPEFFIKAYTDEGDAVFDPFMGSGSTLMAAEKNDRICYGTEISPAYVDVIVNRWQAFTGRQATLEATGQTFAEVEAARS